jgi:hypothetical protein
MTLSPKSTKFTKSIPIQPRHETTLNEDP